MVFDSRLNQLRNHFGITRPEDWRDVAPEWITELPGFGKGILSYIRLELAAKGLTLRNDQTAEFWKQNLNRTHITQAMGDPDDEENEERHTIAPFTVLIDSAEQAPFSFQGMRQYASEGGRHLIVPTEWRSLGRHPDSQGDYSLAGYIGRVGIERKSMDDAHSTWLGWDGRRERFKCELENLSAMQAGLVLVECSWSTFLTNAPEWGKKTRAENCRHLISSTMSWQQKYKVQITFCDSRRVAEITAFEWFRVFWNQREEERKAEKRGEFCTSKNDGANTTSERTTGNGQFQNAAVE